MKVPILIIFSLFGVAVLALPTASHDTDKEKRLSDEDMYHQMAAFVDAHQHIPSDQKLVQNILASAKWAELVAQFGPQSPGKKKAVKGVPERKKPLHK